MCKSVPDVARHRAPHPGTRPHLGPDSRPAGVASPHDSPSVSVDNEDDADTVARKTQTELSTPSCYILPPRASRFGIAPGSHTKENPCSTQRRPSDKMLRHTFTTRACADVDNRGGTWGRLVASTPPFAALKRNGWPKIVILPCSLPAVADSPIVSMQDPLSMAHCLDFGEELLPRYEVNAFVASGSAEVKHFAVCEMITSRRPTRDPTQWRATNHECRSSAARGRCPTNLSRFRKRSPSLTIRALAHVVLNLQEYHPGLVVEPDLASAVVNEAANQGTLDLALVRVVRLAATPLLLHRLAATV